MKLKKREKPKSTTIEYNSINELTNYFTESNQNVYDSIIDSINIAIDKKVVTASPFIIKKKGSAVNCLLTIEKKKWLKTLELIQTKLMENEKYEQLEKLKLTINKIK